MGQPLYSIQLAAREEENVSKAAANEAIRVDGLSVDEDLEEARRSFGRPLSELRSTVREEGEQDSENERDADDAMEEHDSHLRSRGPDDLVHVESYRPSVSSISYYEDRDPEEEVHYSQDDEEDKENRRDVEEDEEEYYSQDDEDKENRRDVEEDEEEEYYSANESQDDESSERGETSALRTLRDHRQEVAA